MEPGENPPGHTDFNGIARSAVGRALQIPCRLADGKDEEILQIQRGTRLQQTQSALRQTPGAGKRTSRNEIDIARGAASGQTQFHRVATFQNPRIPRQLEQPAQQPVEGRLFTKPLDIDALALGQIT